MCNVHGSPQGLGTGGLFGNVSPLGWWDAQGGQATQEGDTRETSMGTVTIYVKSGRSRKITGILLKLQEIKRYPTKLGELPGGI